MKGFRNYSVALRFYLPACVLQCKPDCEFLKHVICNLQCVFRCFGSKHFDTSFGF